MTEHGTIVFAAAAVLPLAVVAVAIRTRLK
jgi:hypothetical protein